MTPFSIATVPMIMLTLVGDWAIIIGASLGVIMGLLAALLGLYWGVAQFYHIIMSGDIDHSFKIKGYFMDSVPYAGYNRFHSEKWNMDRI